MADRQHELTVIVPITTGKRGDLIKYLETTIGYQQKDNAANKRLKNIYGLHFMSLFTFAVEDRGRIPVVPPPEPAWMVSEPAWLVLELSFDGSPSRFVKRLAEGFEQELKAIFNNCEGFTPSHDLATFIEAHRRSAQCVYVSCPGLNRDRIIQEDGLRKRMRKLRDKLAKDPAASAHFVRVAERLDKEFEKMKDHDKDIDKDWPPIPLRVLAGKPFVQVLGVFIPMVLVALSVLAIGRWLSLEELWQEPLFLTFLVPVIVVSAYSLVSAGAGVLLSALVILGALIGAAGAAAISRFVSDSIFYDVIMASRFALAGIAVAAGTLASAFLVLEHRENEPERAGLLLGEKKDTIDTAPVDVDRMRKVCENENSPGCMQNHLVNLSIVKGGILRQFALRTVLLAVHLLGVLYYNKGILGGIPSIHFARWVVLPERDFGRPLLLFMTNYDSSWDSYLGDFVDESSTGVSGIWSNTGGFPRTSFLVFDGGSRFEKQFKAYARKGQIRSSAWFSAYPNLSVQEKLSNAALRRTFEKRRARKKIKMPTISEIAAQDDLLRRL